MPCTPSDDPTSCRVETHWRISATQYFIFRHYSDMERLATLVRRVYGPEPSDSSIFLRADASAPFGLVQRVIEACRKAGIEKIEFGVAAPQPAAKP